MCTFYAESHYVRVRRGREWLREQSKRVSRPLEPVPHLVERM